MGLARRAALFLSISAIFFCIKAKPGDNPGLKPLFKVGVDTVYVKVAVTDPLNRFVTGLNKEDFKLFDNKVEQEILSFLQEPAPVSVGILLDTSGSMKANNNIQAARAALASFLAETNPGDEFFLITFNQNAVLVCDFTQDPGAILRAGAANQPSGQTAIWDAVYRGLDKMKSAKNDRKALILITDGEDNSSRYSYSEVRDFAKESDSQVYIVGEPGDLGYGPSEIQSIAQLSGGRAFFPTNLNSLDYYINLIYSELRNQYVLGYVPTKQVFEGKWHKIQVKLDQPKGMPKLVVRAREGYYADTQ
jgi:Ca-activated chloride channel homolog